MKTTPKIIVSSCLGIVLLGLGGCGGMTTQDKYTIGGAAIGGVAGSALGGGPVGTVGGAAVGGVIGHEVGKNK
jgi:osmotically inducible lipoprotein OsmB